MTNPRKIPCLVEDIIAHGNGVYTVILKPLRPCPRFDSGQFLHLSLDEYIETGFWPESRVFSIASSPLRREELRICYSVKGRYTQRMERELKKGQSVWIKIPYGDFVIQEQGELVLFAGGTGITAFTAFIDMLAPENKNKVYLVYGAKYPSLLLYYGHMIKRMFELPNLRASFMIEQDEGDFFKQAAEGSRSFASRVRYVMGRMHVDEVWPFLADPQQAHYYLAGPPAMLKSLSSELRKRGIDDRHIHIDAWE